MKTKYLFPLCAVAVMAMTASCSDDERYDAAGQGRVIIDTQIRQTTATVTRAAADEDYLNSSLILWISNDRGPVRKYNGLDQIPADGDWLKSGSYLAEAWAGDSVSASFDKRWFKGSKSFEITPGEVTAVTVDCKIANVLVSVVYPEAVTDLLDNVTMTVGHRRGSLSFEAPDVADGRKAYFMMPSNDKNLVWTLKATKKADGAPVEVTGTIENARPATEYILTVRGDSKPGEAGGGYFDINVDTDEVEVYDDIMLELPPIVNGYGFDINDPIVGQPGNVGRRSVFINASDEIVSATVSIDNFSTLLGIKDDAGNDFTDLDLIKCEDAFYERLTAAGIERIYNYDAAEGYSTLKVNFLDNFTNSLPEGNYSFVFTVTDSKDRRSQATLNINVNNAPLELADINAADTWTNRTVLRASVLRDDYGTASFEYRPAGSGAWQTVAATADGTALSAAISGLQPATAYEYRVICTLDNFASPAKTFTTEAASQLPESGFETWYRLSGSNNKLWGIGEEANPFWGSGNSALMKYPFAISADNNPTSVDTSVKHSGNSSVRLKSIEVMGVQFAAGNMFIGEFIRTDGTNGVIGWGRQWTSRPVKLRGYARYAPVAVSRENADYAALKKGDMDQGTIYIALLDDSQLKEDSGKQYPVIVKTKNDKDNPRQLFDKNGSNVIAYGEMVFKDATSGDGFQEFEITLDYKRNDVKPTYIMATASSSIGGDYFVGGDGSQLWLDDLELVYE